MTNPQPETPSPFDSAQITETMQKVAAQSQRLFESYAKSLNVENKADDPLCLADTFTKAMQQMTLDPLEMTKAGMQYWQDAMTLWQNTAERMMDVTKEEPEPVIVPAKSDHRFRDEAWAENPLFDYIKQSYLLASRHVLSTVQSGKGLDDKTQRKLEFYTQQFVDTLSPTNFAVTNPVVLKATVETKGQNLINGFENLLRDLDKDTGKLKVRMTDTKAFEMGKDVATTPGKVVFETDLMQLIQYQPVTSKVYKQPVLIIPPWINKYYILDLRPKNSLVKWLTEQGHTVFIISWVNPDEKHADKGFDAYLKEGAIAALDAIEKTTGVNEINVMGYCLGGTLLATTLGYLNAKGDQRIKTATFLTAMINFKEPGDLGIFVDAEQVTKLEQMMAERGYLEGSEMATTFNMMRANDLIWSFVIHNYLLGKSPTAFDLLYWNSDTTRMPAKMHSFYLREMYIENKLKDANGIEIDGVKIDLSKIKIPVYFLSTRDDHIAPWQSTFMGAQIFDSNTRFVLSGSGHIAGVVNPPAANKYSYWTSTVKPSSVENAGAWLEDATQYEGSWWPDWQNWVTGIAATKATKSVTARKPGAKGLRIIEDAPGVFASTRLDTDC